MQTKRNRIVFCTPPPEKKTGSAGVFNEGGSSFPSLGLLILASIARNEGHEVFFRDFLNTNSDQNNSVREIVKLNPDYVAFSSNTDTIFQASELAYQLKRNNPDVLILIGGPHVSSVPKQTMECCKDFDIAFVGEGEKSFLEFLRSDNSTESLKQIKGICFKNRGDIFLNDRNPLRLIRP